MLEILLKFLYSGVKMLKHSKLIKQLRLLIKHFLQVIAWA